MKVLIDNGQGFVDYTRYVLDGTLTVEDSVNVPTLVSFQLSPSDNSFVVPKRSAYVKVVSEIYTGSVTNLTGGQLGIPAASGQLYIAGPITANFYHLTDYPGSCGENGTTRIWHAWNCHFSTVPYKQGLTGYSLSIDNFNGNVKWFTYDQYGNQTGYINPNIPGSPAEFGVSLVGDMYVPAAGTYYLSVDHSDGMCFAMDGAVCVGGFGQSGAFSDPADIIYETGMAPSALEMTCGKCSYCQGICFGGTGVWQSADHCAGCIECPTCTRLLQPQSIVTGLPVIFAYDTGQGGQTHIYQLEIPKAGLHRFEMVWVTADNLTLNGGLSVVNSVNISGTIIYGSVLQYSPERILATGFVTNEPEREYLGLNQKLSNFNFQQLAYNMNVTSDEWLLNSNAVSYIPAFVNQTDSQILAALAEALAPGFFDITTFMASGTLVPYFQYDPSQTWSDIAKTFADANRYHYKVLNRAIYYQPFGDQPLGIAYDEQTQKEKQLFPLELTTRVLTVPPVNDCIIIGDIEPQANWDNYFVGDGFTSNFQMKHQVFQGTSSALLSDDWTEAQFTQGTWIVNDPAGVISLADNNGNAIGALNVTQKGVLGTYTPIQNATFVRAQNGLELGGGLNLQHGQVTFVDTASGGGALNVTQSGGIVGGLFDQTTNLDPPNCLCGFGIAGQSAIASITISSVQIVNGNTNQVQLTTSNAAALTLQPGNVLAGAGFSTATFLNGQALQVLGVSQIGSNYVITVQSTATYSNPYGPTADSGNVSGASNAVITSASGAAGIVIQPIYNGVNVGPKVISQINHQYVLQTWIGAQAATRFTRPYTNLTQTATYGDQNLTASGTITYVITDVNLGLYVIEAQNPLFGLFPAAPPPVVTKYVVTGANLPSFAVYALISAIDLNIALNYTVLSLPPQGYLTVQSLTGASGGNLPVLPQKLTAEIPYQLGFGMINQTAQVSQSGEAFALSFYTDDIPSVGARIRFQSWAAGQSVARVQDPVAIANEASVSGDSGLRSAIMQNLSPTPRTSDECEAAAAAAILDREYPQFQGTYTIQTIPNKFETLFSPSLYQYPWTGRFLYINSPVRAVTGQNFFVNTVRIQVVELREEVLSISLDYGPDLYLEKLLPSFLEREQNLLVPTQTVPPPNPITLPQVLNAHLRTLDSARITSQVNSVTGNYVTVDLGVLPVTGCEVRYVDSGWGIPNQGRIGLFTSQTFTLPRTIRDQTWYLREINGSIFSRFSKALRVLAPLVPSAPTLVKTNATTIVFDLAGDVRDIYGLEMRVPSVSGVNFITFADVPEDTVSAFSRVALPSSNQVGNAFGIYSPPNGTPPTSFAAGDVIYLTCPTDASFSGLEILTDTGTQTGSTSTENPTTFTGNYTGVTNTGGSASVLQGGKGTKFLSETWSGFGAASMGGSYILSVSSAGSITANAGAGGLVSVSYSLDGGVTFKPIYTVTVPGTIAARTDTVTLPAGQDLTQVQVQASVVAVVAQTGGGATAAQAIGNIQIGQIAATGKYFAWFDHGYTPRNVGTLGTDGDFGSAQLVVRGPNWNVVSGNITAGGVATLTTLTNHGLSPGQVAIVSAGYTTWPGGSYGSMPTDGAIFCGQWSVIAVPAANQFQFNITSNPYTSGLPNVELVGRTAQLPEAGVGQGGVLLQRPVFSPADLVVDLTQPDIAAALQILEAVVPGGRVTGLEGLFFNLTWDYSNPTVVPSFSVPSLSGIIIDSGTQQVSWGIAQGNPDGYRVEILDATTGLMRNRFTVNHPSNPQLLKQFQLSPPDFQSSCTITVTPFDAVSDGIPITISWPGGGGSGGSGGSGGGLTIAVDLPLTEDLSTPGVVILDINDFVGDIPQGSGLRGTVLAPPAGSASGNYYLSASGTWAPIVLPTQPYDVVFSVPGQPPNNFVFPVEVFDRIVNFQANWTGSRGACLVNASASGTYTVKKTSSGVTTTVGTVVYDTSGNFTFATAGGTAVTYNTSDYLSVLTPTPQDSTLSGVMMTFKGTRSGSG